MYYYHFYNSPVGKLTIAADEKNLVGLWIKEQRYYMGVLINKESIEKETEVITCAKKWLDRYFAGEKPLISELAIKFIGSDFQKQVWSKIAEIPYGEIKTYGEIAVRIAEERCVGKMSAQAVGVAVGRNPVSIIVPCHRVMGADGGLTGYSAGIEVKRRLLEFEGYPIGDNRIMY